VDVRRISNICTTCLRTSGFARNIRHTRRHHQDRLQSVRQTASGKSVPVWAILVTVVPGLSVRNSRGFAFTTGLICREACRFIRNVHYDRRRGGCWHRS
jgi:hypothetical protein